VLVAEPGALMSFAGPRVVQQTTRVELPDDFGRAETNLAAGHVDMVVPRGELRETVGRLLGLLAGGTVPVLEAEPDPIEPRLVERLVGRVRRLRHGRPGTNGASA
jgi:acetyl-CoA carboxylase carboxyl transferase subunit beta